MVKINNRWQTAFGVNDRRTGFTPPQIHPPKPRVENSMAIYTLYPCRADGTSETFAALDLGSHKDARREAEHLLRLHQSCVRVVVWLGDRKVATVERQTASA